MVFLFCAFWLSGLWATGAPIPPAKIENPEFGHKTVEFGASIAIDGDTMVVGAPFTAAYGIQESGVARIYVLQPAGNWKFEAELIASDAGYREDFGGAVAISGDTIVVGAVYAYGGKSSSGAAYVFKRIGENWTQQAKLIDPNGATYDYFGGSVAISGDTILVGASSAIGLSGRCGVAFVFTPVNGVWTRQAVLASDDGVSGDYFGTAVALSGETAAIGAPNDTQVNGSRCGSAYIFSRSGSTWTQEAKLRASVEIAFANFGDSVSISGDSVAVGASSDSKDGPSFGRAYVFARAGGVWSEQARLTPADNNYAGFGCSVGLWNDTLFVGALPNLWASTPSGAAYIFGRSGGAWTQKAKRSGYNVTGDAFGCAVAISGTSAAVGSMHTGSAFNGAVFVYSDAGSYWYQSAGLSDSVRAEGDLFGSSVAVSGDTLVVGAQGEAEKGIDSGAVHIFKRIAGKQVFQATLYPSDPASNRRFGENCSIFGDTLAVGSEGVAYVFTRSGGIWTQQARLTAGGAPLVAPSFGLCVALFDDTLLVGAKGAAYVYVRSGNAWTRQAVLTPAGAVDGYGFGTAVALEGDTALIGAYADGEVDVSAGAAYVYKRTGGAWKKQVKLMMNIGFERPQFFGSSVALSGNTALIGATWGKNSRGVVSGSAYVFTESESGWNLQAKLTDNAGASFDYFGASVAISVNMAVVGVSSDDSKGTDAGAVHVYERNVNSWTWKGKLTADDTYSGDYFGRKLALQGSTLVIGALYNDAPEPDSGAAYDFTLSPALTAVESSFWKDY